VFAAVPLSHCSGAVTTMSPQIGPQAVGALLKPDSVSLKVEEVVCLSAWNASTS